MPVANDRSLRAAKTGQYLIEPILEGPNRAWEGHHATNPCAIRLSADPRVFLGYRAGGDADRYSLDGVDVWGSHLGLAILSERGERLVCRLPLPILTVEADAPLPRTKAGFAAYQAGPHRDDARILHDFRLWEDGGWLHVIYHAGTLTRAWDEIVRMPVRAFLERVSRSVEAAAGPVDAMRDVWRRLWWQAGIWEPCGVGGGARVYASEVNKNDIVFVRLRDGSLRMYHRPVPDIAVVDTRGATHCPTAPDGIADFGVLQTCIRPGLLDNSHIGNNGAPVAARVGEVAVFVDVTHGVHNRQVSRPVGDAAWRLLYLPYLRLLDAATGECLYYSEEPILDADEVWRETVKQGTWVSAVDHLDGVMFAGGQVEAEAGRNGLDDLFHCYLGVGDTAVARASFRLRDLLPGPVIADIEAGPAHRAIRTPGEPTTCPLSERLCGWEWSVVGSPAGRDVWVARSMLREGRSETARRPIGRRPGRFDADGLFFDGRSLRRLEGLGWCAAYRGVRWEEGPAGRRTAVGHGLLLLDLENPERVLYRSAAPIGEVTEEAGWTDGRSADRSAEVLARAEQHIPAQVALEIRRIYSAQPMPSDMTRWLKRRSGVAEQPAGSPRTP